MESLGYVLGPAVAGVLVHRIGPAATLALDGASFTLSGLAIVFAVPRAATASRQDRDRRPWSSVVSDVQEAWQWVRREAAVQEATVIWGVHRLLFAMIIPGLTYLIVRTWHGPVYYVGLMVALYALGSLGGTLLQPHTAAHQHVWARMAFLLFGIAAVLVSLWGRNAGILSVSAFMLGFAEGYLLVWYLTTRASRVPAPLSGRVYSLTAGLTQGLGALGLLLMGTMLSAWGGPEAWRITGTAAIIAAALWTAGSLGWGGPRPAS